MSFEPDKQYEQAALAYAEHAVAFARDMFGKQLDFSIASIAIVETMLGTLHERKLEAGLSEQHMTQFAQMLGSYIGEVFRKHYGAAWGKVTLEAQVIPGMRAQNGTVFWPPSKAYGRIVNGPEDDVSFYFHALTKDLAPLAPARPPPPGRTTGASPAAPKEGKPSWMKRLFGA